MQKFDKEDEMMLRAYCDRMPIVMHNTSEVHIMKGSEILELGHVELNGKKIDPEKKYHYRMPVQVAANHYRRMKKAWIKDGEKGIAKYINGIVKLKNEQQTI